jgi:predicted transcriptional regulator YdeE
MSDTTGTIKVQQPAIIEFGPVRVIGMNYIGKNENQEIPALWGGENGFVHRMGEIQTPEGMECMSFGICRCVPGADEKVFNYIACLPAAADAPIPDGMVEAVIGQHSYAVFEVPNLALIGKVWEEVHKWVETSTEWISTCGPDKCECAEYPFFELYPADFSPNSKLYIHAPVKPKK